MESAPTAVAETRKTVTVLFCDATSSTALGERIDPESLRGLMTRYFDVMREVIEFHGGVVEKFIGDAVMAVFGVPVVHEDDALRACRAAVEIRERLAVLDGAIQAERGATVEWRMGINTGEVVAGDSSTGQRIVTGDAVNVAARLEGAAAPGHILLGADTVALVRSAVETEAVEPLSLKGKAELVPAWRLIGVKDSLGRQARPLEAPLVGRRRPLRLLDDAFHEAVEERICHLFTLLGAAGVGKSRLVEEFLASVSDQAQVAQGRCLAYGRGITYWPAVEAIRDGLGITEEEPPESAARHLREALAAEPDADRIAGVVGGLLGLSPAVPASEEMFWAIRKTFEAMARHRPLVLVFDDIHWGEETFLDLIEHMAEWTRDAPILVIAMARPELFEKRPAWGGGKRWVTTMQLEPLSEVESDELVASLLGRADIPAEFRAHISHAAEGNPLFVEELLGKLIDDGFLVRSGDGWDAPGDLAKLTLPPTIQALLAARLDGLSGEERAVIERASVEGKVFHRGAVTALAPESLRPQVRDRLASLMRMELVRPDQASFAGDEAFRFRHLLIRDAAYQALAKQTRSELHEQFAAWLKEVVGERQTEYEEIIGYHLEQAFRYRAELGPPDAHAQELGVNAAKLLMAAGRRADVRHDVHAALGLLERALDLLPDGAPEWRLGAADLARVLYESGEARRAETMLVEVIDLGKQVADELGVAQASLTLLEIQTSVDARESREVIVEAEELGDTLERLGDPRGAWLARVFAAANFFFSGRAAEAERRIWPLVKDADEAGYSKPSWLFGAIYWGPTPAPEAINRINEAIRPTDLGATYKRHLGGLTAMEGRFDDARRLLAEAKQEAEDLGMRPAAISVDGHFLGPLEMLAGNYERAADVMIGSYEALSATGDRSFASTIAGWAAMALAELGRYDEAWRFAAIARETSSDDDVASQGPGRAAQARVLAARGDFDAAVMLAAEAVALSDATDYLHQIGDMRLQQARVLHDAGRTPEALESARLGLKMYERKGVVPSIERTRNLVAEWSR